MDGKYSWKREEEIEIDFIDLLKRLCRQWKQIAVCALAGLESVRTVVCDLGNISDLPRILAGEKVDICIHLGWDGAGGQKRADADRQLDNVKDTVRLCRALHEMGVKRFAGAGSLAEKDAAYCLSGDGAVPGPASAYGAAKLSAHYFSRIVCGQYGMEHVWCTLANVYGAGDRTENFISSAVKRMLHGERASFTEGSQMYDFIYISDAAEGLLCASLYGRDGREYYIGSMEPRPLRQYAEEIRSCIDPGIELYFGEIPFHGRCLPEKEFDASKIYEDTGFRPQIRFSDGIMKTVQWFREEEQWAGK